MSQSHVALYRKYRPEKFKDVVGQDQVVTLLTNSIKQKKISHAYLFCGGKGTGKTTVARIVAREIGCNGEDIIEIDAASNRGIDEIRELRDAVRTHPFSSPYKVYIIDEAHMLTKEAANALLKTLEEPPSHVVFILATTDPDRLPQTIVSRCQKIEFKSPTIEILSKRLIDVAKDEEFNLSKESAELIAQHGKNSYRDALGILEQILSISKKDIKHEHVVDALGAPDKEMLLTLLELVCEKNPKEVLLIFNRLSSGNRSALRTYDEFIEMLRQGIIMRIKQDTKDKGELARLSLAHPHTVGSKMVLELLQNRHLLEVSESHSWAAFLAILLNQIELGN
jgi:DNA polymerase-3 subunit gamma/tau